VNDEVGVAVAELYIRRFLLLVPMTDLYNMHL